jgi:surface antigen
MARTLAELCRKEPAVKEILEAIDPAMAGFDISQPEGRQTAREAVTTSLKIVDALDQLDWQMASRMSDGPVLAVDQFHPWGPG